MTEQDIKDLKDNGCKVALINEIRKRFEEIRLVSSHMASWHPLYADDFNLQLAIISNKIKEIEVLKQELDKF